MGGVTPRTTGSPAPLPDGTARSRRAGGPWRDAPTAAGFFALLRRVLPRDAIVVTDSGLHQGLVRRHFDVLAPRRLVPSDFVNRL